MLTNSEVLEMLVQVQEQTGDWRSTLDELVDTFDKAVADAEQPDLFDDTEAEPSRWESAGIVPGDEHYLREYRDTL